MGRLPLRGTHTLRHKIMTAEIGTILKVRKKKHYEIYFILVLIFLITGNDIQKKQQKTQK
jgi:hypothetical protein